MNIQDIMKQASSVEHQLFIKYSLVKHPSKEEITSWLERTEYYLKQGLSKDEAGRKAASEAFEVDLNIIRKSQADTIEALLEKAKKKVDDDNE
ncbi:hypothetical protein [Vibrio kanaloae]|uniref:hypothetical protein n=1 Tax=Vibrio kanaloae TaxID=170673 RepID=UPI001EFE1F91|nr:hypothetical protein [Vibrio kanaloae]MCG9559868.1 hypothetical protein [Vibrio kanaloae]